MEFVLSDVSANLTVLYFKLQRNPMNRNYMFVYLIHNNVMHIILDFGFEVSAAVFVKSTIFCYVTSLAAQQKFTQAFEEVTATNFRV
jgi:hypothetical protein